MTRVHLAPPLAAMLGCVLSIPVIIFAVIFSLPTVALSQIRGHTAGLNPPPLPTMVHASLAFFCRKKRSALSSLVDPPLIALHEKICI